MKDIIKEQLRKILLEGSKKKILMDKLGLSEVNAEILDEICGSLAVWMANKLIGHQLYIVKSYRNFDDNVKMTQSELVEKMNSNNLASVQRSKITSIMDYIRVGLNGNIQSVKDLSFYDLYQESKKWHDSLEIGLGQINYDEKNPIVIDFRNDDGDGFYWTNLRTNNSPEECERMGHCGRSSLGNLYSLRQYKQFPGGKFKINKSHLTAAIGGDGILYQLKGPKNSKPEDKYNKLILPLFYIKDADGNYLIEGLGSEYAANQDFKLSDLPKETIVKLYNDRPELFEKRSLQRLLITMGIIDKPPIDYKFTLNINPDDIGTYVKGDYKIRTRKWKDKETGRERTSDIWLFDTIMSGDVWDLWGNYDADWKLSLEYYVDDKSAEKIWEIVKTISEKNEIDIEGMSLEDAIEEVDDEHEIRSAISNATNNAESSSYVDYLWNTLKSALEEFGNVTKFNDEGVTIEMDLSKYLNDVDDDILEDFFDNCNDDVECVFGELIHNDYIEKPEFDIDDRWTPGVNEVDFNDSLMDYLADVNY
jgi:hypothetical protein